MSSPVLDDPSPAPVVLAPPTDRDLLTPDPSWALAVRTRLLAQHPAMAARGTRRLGPWLHGAFASAVVVILLGTAVLRWPTTPVTSSPPPLLVPSLATRQPTPTPTPPVPTGQLTIVDAFSADDAPEPPVPPLPPGGLPNPWTRVPAAALQAGIPFSVTYPTDLPVGARLSETWQLTTVDDTGVRVVYDSPVGRIEVEQTKPTYPVRAFLRRDWVIEEVNINGRYGVLYDASPSRTAPRLEWVQRGVWVVVTGTVERETLIRAARSVPTP